MPAIVILILLTLLAALSFFLIIIMLQTVADIAGDSKPKNDDVFMVINQNTLLPEVVCGHICFKQQPDMHQAEMQVKY